MLIGVQEAADTLARTLSVWAIVISGLALIVAALAAGFEVFKYRVTRPKFAIVLKLTSTPSHQVLSARIVNDGPDALPLLFASAFSPDHVFYDTTDRPVVPESVGAHSSELFITRLNNLTATDPRVREATFQVAVIRKDMRTALSNVVRVPVCRYAQPVSDECSSE